MIEVFRHAGQIDLNLRDVVGGAHSRVLLRSNTPEIRDIVQQMADGKGYMAITITEPVRAATSLPWNRHVGKLKAVIF